jgi:uncharacterized membrane protein HdeD (DUF308 family)
VTVSTADELRKDAMCALLAQNWWATLIRGIAAILFGLAALIFTGPAILSLVLVFAVYALLDGVFGILAAVRAARRHEHWAMLLLGGIVSLIAAVAAVTMPGIAALVFVFLVAAWCLVTGVFSLIAAFRLKGDYGQVWLGLGAVISIIFGVLLFIAPETGAVVLTWWVGIYALVFGVSLVVLAFRLRPHRDDFATGAVPHGA